MTRELELITAAIVADARPGPRAAGPGAGPKHAIVHTECLNCGEPLHGAFCYACGQDADDHHRSIFHLMWEAVEGLTHLDGRLARTLPALLLRPGTLALDHIEGRRQRHVPPLRLFFVSLLVFMLALEMVVGGSTRGQVQTADGHAPRLGDTVTVRDSRGASTKVHIPSAAEIADGTHGRLTPAQVEALTSGGGLAGLRPHVTFGLRPAGAHLASVQVDGRPAAPGEAIAALTDGHKPAGLEAWLVEHGRKAQESQEYFKSVAFEWAHRLAILMLPIFALLLTGCYFYKRKFYVYDHLIVSMQFLSFVFLVWAIAYVVPEPAQGLAMVFAAVWTPVNLFMTLRGAYGSSVLGAGVKALGLWTASLILFLALLLGILVVALGQM